MDSSSVLALRKDCSPEHSRLRQWGYFFVLGSCILIILQGLGIGAIHYLYPTLGQEVPIRTSVYYGVVQSGSLWNLLLYPALCGSVLVINIVLGRMLRRRSSSITLFLYGLSFWWTCIMSLYLRFLVQIILSN